MNFSIIKKNRDSSHKIQAALKRHSLVVIQVFLSVTRIFPKVASAKSVEPLIIPTAKRLMPVEFLHKFRRKLIAIMVQDNSLHPNIHWEPFSFAQRKKQ